MPPPPDPFHVLRTHSASLASIAFGGGNTLLYSGGQDGFVSITDLRTRRSILFWKAHEGGVLGVGEWDGRLITHGRDNLIHIYDRLPLVRRAGQLNGAPTSGSGLEIWKSLSVNSLNFCGFTLLPIPVSTSVPASSGSSSAGARAKGDGEAEALLAVPNLLDTELADIYHLPSMRRLHAGVNTPKANQKGKAKAGPADATRSGLIMSLHLRFLRLEAAMASSSSKHGDREQGKLVLVLGYEDGRVDMWGMPVDTGSTEGGEESWRAFSDGSGQVGKRGWEVMWSGKGHNEAVMAMAVSSDARYAYTVSADHLLVKYDMARALTDPSSQNLVTSFSTKQIGNASLAISSSDTILAVGGWDGKVRLFSAASGKPLGTLGYHRETVQCLAFPQGAEEETGEAEVLPDPSTIELGEEDSDDDDGPGGRGGGKERWFVSGGKDRRVALWELMDFTRVEGGG